jgi:hypothetical protein
MGRDGRRADDPELNEADVVSLVVVEDPVGELLEALDASITMHEAALQASRARRAEIVAALQKRQPR